MKQSNLTPKEIKNLRISNGLKQRECAEIVGVGIRQWQ
jgi:DNA-binding transcriptional regulator YiaG